MTCPNCGKEITNDSKFCEYCGTKVNVASEESKKKTNWWGIFFGGACILVGIIVWPHFVGNSEQVEESQRGTVYYGTYIGNQYIYEGLYDAIKKNYEWNSTKYKPEQGDYEITNVCYKGEVLLQIVPRLGSQGVASTLSVYVEIPPSKSKKFKNISTFSYFYKEPGCENFFCATCQNDLDLTAIITSDVLQNVFDVPHGATLNYND